MTFTFVVSLTFAFSRQMSNFLLDLVYLLSSKSTFRNIWRMKNKNLMPKRLNKKHKYEIKLFSRFFGGWVPEEHLLTFYRHRKRLQFFCNSAVHAQIFFDKLEGWKGVFQQDPRKKYFGSTRGGSLWTAPTLCVFVYRWAMNISLHLSTSYTWNSQYEWFHK